MIPRLFIIVLFTTSPFEFQGDALTNKDVIELLDSGLSEEVVTAKIRSAGGNFDTSAATLLLLRQAKVPDAVIIAMIESSPKPPAAPTSDCLPLEKGEPIRIRVQSSSSEAKLTTELLGQISKEGAKQGFTVQSVGESEPFHLRLMVVGGVTIGSAHTAAVLLSGDCKLIDAVIRSGRWSKGGAARAVGKELAKHLAARLETGELQRAVCPR